MEAYAQVLSIAIPGFIVLIIIEELVARNRGIQVNRAMDTISSLSSGMTNTLKSLVGLSVVIVSYTWMESYLGIFDIQSTVWLYVLAWIGLDFVGYWTHRFNHSINLFWNRHFIHHSSEEFNLSCALRQSISAWVGVYFFLYIPMAVIGIPPKVVAITAPIHLFAQFWYHTRLVDKMGFLEHILVTPSHHRVHHAINDEYLDKNFAQIFIVWDKWFGTFQEELPNVPAVYGTKKQSNTWNPIIINYIHLSLLAKDAFYALKEGKIFDAFRLWFMPTGWRPEGFNEKYPIEIVTPENIQKYETAGNDSLTSWSWFQLAVNNGLVYFIMMTLGELTYQNIVLACAFSFVSIFAFTTLMDRHPSAFLAEVVKFIFGGFLIYLTGGWFGLDNLIPLGSIIVGAYFVLSLAGAYYFSVLENSKLASA